MPTASNTPEVLSPSHPWVQVAGLGPHGYDALFGNIVSLLDALVLFGSFALAYWVRDWYLPGTLEPFRQYLWLGLIVLPIWLILARATPLASPSVYRLLSRVVWLTLKVQLVGSLILLSGLYLLKAVEVSRLLMQTFIVIGAAAMVLERVAIHAFVVHWAGRWNKEARRLLVIGPTQMAAHLQDLLRTRPYWGASIAGVIDDSAGDDVRAPVPVLGGLDELSQLLDTHVFDEVVMVDVPTARDHGKRVMGECLERGLAYRTLIMMPGHAAASHYAEEITEGVYLMSVERTPRNLLSLGTKRALDIVAGVFGLAFCGLAFVIVAPFIRLESRGPVIFRQTRVGRNGRRFTIYKFRSMRSDAEQQRHALATANEMNGHLFKIRYDPRVTLVGRFLRRTYLDEFPQFWNVLKGDMSLVGTRPPMPDEVTHYAPHHRRRLSMRPGITGLWQSQGNGRVSDFERVVELDCEYIDRWSLALDCRILLRTFGTVIRLAGH